MKVIGIAVDGRYLVEIEHSEIEKVLGKYYNKLNRLKAGDNVNLAEAHDYSVAISSACRDMTVAMKGFGRAQDTMRRFAEMVAKTDQKPQEES